MIFVTVGTQLAFDRLVGAVDAWAAGRPEREVIAQVGPSEREFPALRVEPFVPPARFKEMFARAELVIAHAGMGTILSALEAGKPLLVMPRRASLGEHRNEHQMATVARLEGRLGLAIARDEHEVGMKIDALLAGNETTMANASPPAPDQSLLSFIRAFVDG